MTLLRATDQLIPFSILCNCCCLRTSMVRYFRNSSFLPFQYLAVRKLNVNAWSASERPWVNEGITPIPKYKMQMISPPVNVCKCNIFHRFNILLYLTVDFLTPSWKLRQGKIPLSITVLQQLAGAVKRLLKTLPFELIGDNDVILFSKGLDRSDY